MRRFRFSAVATALMSSVAMLIGIFFATTAAAQSNVAAVDHETTTVLTASASEIYAGLSVTLTVDVSGAGDEPTGSVSIAQCVDDCASGIYTTISTVELEDGQADLTTVLHGSYSASGPVTYSFRATYLGSDSYSQSQSDLVEVTATPNATTTVVTSDVNPSTLGQEVTFTARVTSQTGPDFISSPAPSGVTFYNGDVAIGYAGIGDGTGIHGGPGNIAVLTTDQLPTGMHNITARLNTNERNFLGSTSDVFVQNVILTVFISGPEEPVSDVFNLTVTFSSEITDFVAADIIVENGVVSELEVSSTSQSSTEVSGASSADGSVFIATITPTQDGIVDILIPEGAARDSAGNGNTNSAQYSVEYVAVPTLTVSLPGLGSGAVASAPTGVSCGTDCTEEYAVGTSVTLTAAADTGSTFASWTSGPCIGTSTVTCTFTMSADTRVSARFELENPPAGRVVAATLPGARSGFVGGPVITVFVSVVSRASTPAQSCRLVATNGAPFTVSYQQLNAQGQHIGAADPLFDLEAGGSASFVLGMSPQTSTGSTGYLYQPRIECQNATLDPIAGVNSVLVSIGDQPVPDILSIGAVPSNDGVIRIPSVGGIQFMSAAAVNIGAGDGTAGAGEVTVTVSADTGGANLPLTLQVCETASTGGCIAPRSETVQSVFSPNVAKFFAVFVRGSNSAGIPFSPANARVYLSFVDGNGVLRSQTSAAVTSPSPDNVGPPVLAGSYSVLIRLPEGEWPSLARARLTIDESGQGELVYGEVALPVDASLLPYSESPEIQSIVLDGALGVLSSQGAIIIGDPTLGEAGAFWGVREAH